MDFPFPLMISSQKQNKQLPIIPILQSMKRIFTTIQKEAGRLMLLSILACAITSCDSILDFDDGDCTIEYRVKFKYDYNMKYADAFKNEVNTVTLYAFDDDGNFIYQHTEEGNKLKADDYSMKIDIEPGNYHLVAWAGVNDKSFAIPLMEIGESTLNDLTVKTNRETATRGSDDTYIVSGDNHKLSPLWHAESRKVVLTRSAREQVITLSLTKNTNNIRIILQQTGSKTINVEDFDFSITDDNGWMDCHNNLLKDDMLKYLPFYRTSGTVDEETTRTEGEEEDPVMSVAVAQITTARLMADKKAILRITNKKNGKTVLAIPLIEYLLLTKSQEHVIDNQEYLDRQDEYSMTFFLDENQTWLKTTIIINGWTIRLNEIEDL